MLPRPRERGSRMLPRPRERRMREELEAEAQRMKAYWKEVYQKSRLRSAKVEKRRERDAKIRRGPDKGSQAGKEGQV